MFTLIFQLHVHENSKHSSKSGYFVNFFLHIYLLERVEVNIILKLIRCTLYTLLNVSVCMYIYICITPLYRYKWILKIMYGTELNKCTPQYMVFVCIKYYVKNVNIPYPS